MILAEMIEKIEARISLCAFPASKITALAGAPRGRERKSFAEKLTNTRCQFESTSNKTCHRDFVFKNKNLPLSSKIWISAASS